MSEEKTLPSDKELNEESETEEETEETEEESEEGNDSVTLTKEEHDKLLKERDNYRKVALSKKKEAKQSKKEDYVTKSDLRKGREKEAIDTVLEGDEEMDKAWDEFITYIPKISNTDSVEDIKRKIKAGYAGYKSTLEESEGENKDAKANISKSSGKGGKSPEGSKKERKRVLLKDTGMTDWYPKKEED